MPTVAFDESGNTGENLLDPRQPLYALASVHVDPRDAETLATETLLPGQTELKFASFRGSRRGRARIIAALQSGLLLPGAARVTPVHKPFMVVAKLFDELIEPEFHERGINLYATGRHVALANLLYRFGPISCGTERWNRLLTAYVGMERDPTDQTINAFLDALRLCQLSATHLEVRRLIDIIDPRHVRWAVRLGTEDGTAFPTLDPAFPALVENISWWEDNVGRFVLEHDETPVVARLQPRLEELMAADAVQRVGRFWAERMRLPLGVDEIRFVASQQSRQVQLADLVAGSCLAWIAGTTGTGDADFAAQLAQTPLPQLVENEIWPEPLNPLARFR